MADGIRKEIEDLRERIRRHDYQYYVVSDPKVSDKEYDDLLNRLKALEEAHPQYRSADSPTVRVGGGILEGFAAVRHRAKMVSLDNTYSIDELREWDQRVRKGLGDEHPGYVVELKIDGVSANITYEKGRLTTGATRGDGEAGEDVTQNIKTIRAIPLVLIGGRPPALIEIRGEVYMERRDFESVNKSREESGEALFANPRNAASGSLKQLDSAVVSRRHLNFFAHSLGACEGAVFATQAEYLEKLKEWGVRTNPHVRLCATLDDVIVLCRAWQEKRDTFSYEIDGIVVKVNSFRQQERLGWTMKSPRWAVAYKFPARQATTDVVRITLNVGRTGVITPTAELKPVPCGGVIISHATLHNFDEIGRLNVKEGDRVLVERAGDVIPKVVKVVADAGGKPFPVPRACPVCSGKVVKEKDGDVACRCINPLCGAQIERGLLHFGSRSAMDIEGLGEAVAAQLVELKLVKDISDIFRLKEEDLLKLELFKKKKAGNLLARIEASKKKPLSKLLFGLGIRHVGEKAAYVLARHFNSMANLMNAGYHELVSIHEIGPVLAQSITDYFSQKSTRKLIGDLEEAGLKFTEDAPALRRTALTGAAVVFTGELRRYSRAQAEEMVRSCGGNPSSSVSAATDFVVAGDAPGSKYDKARKLGVKIISEREFEEMVK